MNIKICAYGTSPSMVGYDMVIKEPTLSCLGYILGEMRVEKLSIDPIYMDGLEYFREIYMHSPERIVFFSSHDVQEVREELDRMRYERVHSVKVAHGNRKYFARLKK